ncbi:MAG: hypothetical protein V4484_00010 [Pseudomonadota bacterium]
MEKLRYIVRARTDTGALADFLAMIQNDPSLELVDTIGPAQRPHTAVIAVTPQQALAFEQRLRNTQQLVFERDQPMSLFDTTAGALDRTERNTNG